MQIVNWRHVLDQKWAALRLGEVKVKTDDKQRAFEVQVYLDDLEPNTVHVELYADGIMGSATLRHEMKCVRSLVGASGGYLYGASVSATRSPLDYTARAIPHCQAVAIPLQDRRILWQR